MKIILLLLITLSSFTSFAQDLPWPEGQQCGRHIGVNVDGKFIENYTQYNWYAYAWREYITDLAVLMRKPDIKMSFEYMQYRFGYSIMKDVDYAPDCEKFEPFDEEILALKKKQQEGTLTKDDFKGPRWIHAIQAIDVEEVNCLAMSKKNGIPSGCGDIWQGGITEDEAVCIKGKTYLRCHVDCIEQIYNRKIELTPGFCL